MTYLDTRCFVKLYYPEPDNARYVPCPCPFDCTADQELRRAAMEDSACGSASDLQLHVWEAAVRGDPKNVRAAATAIVERYPDGRNTEGWQRISEFIDLLPALADPKHVDRERALDFFGRDNTAVVLRWIWIRHYKLSAEDGIRFLGGREVEYVRKVLALALQKDAKGADAALCDVNAPKTGITAQTIMAYWAFHELNGVSQDIGEDVMPSSARFTRAAVVDRLNRRSSSGN
ncbi:MAG TPA: hypothetical protein PLX89_14200 [Verrucomicrobiota bacterium]|nr:hypothetical protein [Verrucomicrobiales bacterium]HRI14144.1 hypothetical protein [Verrucomicrobiota bacterium]